MRLVIFGKPHTRRSGSVWLARTGVGSTKLENPTVYQSLGSVVAFRRTAFFHPLLMRVTSVQGDPGRVAVQFRASEMFGPDSPTLTLIPKTAGPGGSRNVMNLGAELLPS